MTKPQTLKGFRDFSPSQMRVRNFVSKIIRESFESFGFEPLETPTLEYAETLLNKYSSDTDKETYIFKDLGDRKVGLIYDLTVPTARYLTQNADSIKLPFKRYQMQRCYRAEKPQKGRYREFMQCDIDIFGEKSPLADAEVLACAFKVIEKLKLDKGFSFKISSREVLYNSLSNLQITDISKQQQIARSLDKLDKIGQDAVSEDLVSCGFSISLISQLFSLIYQVKPSENLKAILDYAILLGIPSEKLVFSPTLSRGADYYTGMVVEGVVAEPKIGSILGGGRYNNLIKSFGGADTPATGLSFGFERICDVLLELNLLDKKITTPPCKTLVVALQQPTIPYSLKVLTLLRENGIPAEIYLNQNANIAKQLKYASEKNIPYAVIIGPNEIAKNVVVLKDLTKRTQTETDPKNLISLIV
jgi:histidyl-tRNA synthetase